MLRRYDRGLNWVFRHQFSTLLSTIALIALTGYLYYVIPKGFIPQEDTGFLFAAIEARQDTSFAEITKMQERGFENHPAKSGRCRHGRALPARPAATPSESTARIFIQLKPMGEREGVEKVMQELRAPIAKVIGAKFYMQVPQDITVGGRLTQAQYQYTLTDTNADELNHWAPILLSKMQPMKTLTDVASDQQIASPEIVAEVDRSAASTYGVRCLRLMRRYMRHSGNSRSQRSMSPLSRQKSSSKCSQSTRSDLPPCREFTYLARTECRCRLRRWRTSSTRCSR